MNSSVFFFLEYAGELRIIVLKREKLDRPLTNTTTSLRAASEGVVYITSEELIDNWDRGETW
jgi:hypothetical protein